MSWKTSLKLQTPYKTSARAFMPKYNHWTDFKGVCCWPHSDAHRRPRCSTCRRIERCLHYFAAATQHSCRQETSIRLMLWSTNEWSGVSMHWNAIKHNAEQSSFFHENTLHVHKKASAKTTTGKLTQTRQIPRINLQRRLHVFQESGTYRMMFSVKL